MQYSYKISQLSESALMISFEQVIDEQLNEYIVQLAEEIKRKPFVGVQEVVAAYASLTIFYDVVSIYQHAEKSPGVFVQSYVKKIIEKFDYVAKSNVECRVVEIPVIYDGEDLAFVCKETGLSEAEFVRLHTEPLYRVYMMGFLPGFAYLGGMDRRLAVPRRDSPRLKVPAGSVGIAGEQTGVYPVESPGGWQLIGRTKVPIFTPDDESITLINQGDYVRFTLL